MCFLIMDLVIIILLLFLDCGFSRGQDSVDMSGKVSLRFNFDPYYNFHEKFCCRFYQYSCATFVNNRGYAADLYKGRLSITEYNGLMVVTIWNLQKSDAGGYRCAINGVRFPVYTDYFFTVSDRNSRQSPPQPSMPSSSRPTKINMLTTSATPVERSNVSHSDGYLRLKSNTWVILTAVLTVLVMIILIISVTTMVVHLRKKEKEKSGSASCDTDSSSLSGLSSQDDKSIVYTTVNFKTSEEPAVLYANLKSSAATYPQKCGPQDIQETVEYSTLAIKTQLGVQDCLQKGGPHCS